MGRAAGGSKARWWLRTPAAAALAAALMFGPLPGAAVAQAPDPARAALSVLETELTLVLDRYPQALPPGPLLAAAMRGADEAAGGAALAQLSAAESRDAAWATFEQRFRELVQGGADPVSLARASGRAMARSLEDCHTSFALDYQKELANIAGGERYGGIGASVLDASEFDPPAPGPVVVYLKPDGPGRAAGLRAGDAVLSVDGVDAAALAGGRLVELVRGAPGTPVRLLLDRPGTLEPVEVVVERGEVQVSLLDWSYLEPASPEGNGVGYLALRGFASPVERLLPRAVEDLRAQGARAWVLDLREDGGGDMHTFTTVASTFIHEGPLAVTVDRRGAESVVGAVETPAPVYAEPLALLVDSHSASAAELLAADAQDYGRARLFGTTTAGCFGNSQLFRLPEGMALWLTVRTLQSGGARRDVNKAGVVPDEVITRSREALAAGRDRQLERALEWVREQA